MGRGGAGLLWDMNFSDAELARTSLVRPTTEELIEDLPSDVESTISETPPPEANEAADSTEGVPEVKFPRKISQEDFTILAQCKSLCNLFFLILPYSSLELDRSSKLTFSVRNF